MKRCKENQVVRELADWAEQRVLRWFGHVERENGRRAFAEEDNKIERLRYWIKGKTANKMDRQCEKSNKYKRDISGVRSDCA